MTVFVKGHITDTATEAGVGGATRGSAIDTIGDVRGLRVLDYGCGYGGLGLYLSQARSAGPGIRSVAAGDRNRKPGCNMAFPPKSRITILKEPLLADAVPLELHDFSKMTYCELGVMPCGIHVELVCNTP